MAKKKVETIEDDFNNRLKTIRDALYTGGGSGQASVLVHMMLLDGTLQLSHILSSIEQIVETQKAQISEGTMIPVDMFFTGREHDAYACLDKDLKFCVRHYGEEDWTDITYVFPNMNVCSAFSMISRNNK